MNPAASSKFDRVLRFDAIHNFRDSGGYATAGGGRLRRGRLYRSAQHKDATDADLAAIRELGLGAVVDLRSDKEREVAPCRRIEGFAAPVLFVSDHEADAAPHIAASREVNDAGSAAARMIESYAEMPFRPMFRKALHRYFTALADAEGPVLIHCMAGKDRTGLAVALLHSVLGVAREDWMDDYLLTNAAGNVEARIAAGATHVRAAFGRTLDDDTVRVLMTVRPAFIGSAFAAIDERHGGVAGYLAACDIDAALVARVAERQVER